MPMKIKSKQLRETEDFMQNINLPNQCSVNLEFANWSKYSLRSCNWFGRNINWSSATADWQIQIVEQQTGGTISGPINSTKVQKFAIGQSRHSVPLVGGSCFDVGRAFGHFSGACH